MDEPLLNDILTWLLRLEDRGLTGIIVNLGNGRGETRFGITSADPVDARYWTLDPEQALLMAKTYYRKLYWEACGLERLGMPLAASVLSCAVNCGAPQAMRFLENARDRGVMQQEILRRFIERWITHYQWLASMRPQDEKFLAGWIKRANTIYPALPD